MTGAAQILRHHQPTPPMEDNNLYYDLQHLAQHNASQQYRPGYEHHKEGYYTRQNAHPGSAYASPMITTQGYLPSQYPDPRRLDMQYDTHPPQASGYYDDDHSENLYYAHHGSPSSQPMTPGSSGHSDAGRRTRSGRSIAPSSSPKSAQPRSRNKKNKPKSEKLKTPELPGPLSELTKDMDVPLRDMGAWVNRSIEERQKEVEKRNGYVTRPMNSFMLYRSAYAERTKQWCLQNNHQVVSSVSGESWPMEPESVREMYNEFAKIERLNHQKAHPSYKFSPSKAAPKPQKKRGHGFVDTDGELSEASDEDDGDAEWAPSSRSRTSRRQAKRQGTESYGYNTPVMQHATWEVQDTRPLPAGIGNADLYQQYYHRSVHPTMGYQSVEEAHLSDAHLDTGFGPTNGLLGLPTGQQYDNLLSSHYTPMPQEPQVDPMLLGFENQQYVHQANDYDPNIPFDSQTAQQLPYDSGHHAVAWQGEHHGPALDHGSEFEKWMES